MIICSWVGVGIYKPNAMGALVCCEWQKTHFAARADKNYPGADKKLVNMHVHSRTHTRALAAIISSSKPPRSSDGKIMGSRRRF
jgi:hypothetical protein